MNNTQREQLCTATAHGAAAVLIAPDGRASYDEALVHMKRHLVRLASRFRVDVADVRQTLYLVWKRVVQLNGGRHTEDRQAFYKYLYRALENELTDSIGVHPQGGSGLLDEKTVALQDVETRGGFEIHDECPFAEPLVPPVDEQIRALLVRSCAELAFPEAVRTHPLYAHPSFRIVLEGILNEDPVDRIAERLGVTRRRVNAQIEDIYRLFVKPDAAHLDRIFRAVPEHQWLPGAPLTRRPLEMLRYAQPNPRAGHRILRALRRFMLLGTQPAVVYVDQFDRVLSGVEVCVAARILGVGSVATLLQVARSTSPELQDEAYRNACDIEDDAAELKLDLIAAFQKLYDEGYLSELVATFLDQVGKHAQYIILRELGTGLVPLLGTREARGLVKAAREGTIQSEARTQRDRLITRFVEQNQAAA